MSNKLVTIFINLLTIYNIFIANLLLLRNVKQNCNQKPDKALLNKINNEID